MVVDRLEVFTADRGRLFGLAYRMLGEASEAEDVLQDAFLRWQQATGVERPAAWLTTVVTRLCLTRLDSARARRETYVGQWLPEPVDTSGGALGPMETVEQRESVSLGVLVLLEQLTPPERAVFVLREAFDHRHGEIAEILGIDEAHSRQLLRRARTHVRDGRRRFDHDPDRQSALVQRFFAATVSGDLADLEELLAADAVAWADGGGSQAARRPIVGADKVQRYLLGLTHRPEAEGVDFAMREINGAPAMVVTRGDTVVGVFSADLVDERVAAVRLFVHPEKLGRAIAT